MRQARLRNGDALAGSNALAKDFFPRTSYRWLESLIEEAKFFHTGKLVLQLEEILISSSLDGPRLRGALTLAGYIGDPRLAQSVKIAWDNALDKVEVLITALWAAFRCADDEPVTCSTQSYQQFLRSRTKALQIFRRIAVAFYRT